jgi:TatD DNase family protein
MKIIDIGINLMHASFKSDREEVIRQAEALGVSPLIITGTGEKASREALHYAASMPGKLYATAGVHPHEARFCNDSTIANLKELAVKYKAVAIGECGLDYNRDFSPRDVQRKWFEKQIELAIELQLPLFLHERDAFPDFNSLLTKYADKVPAMVVHCFTGSEEALEKYIGLGCYIGLTGWICDERRGTHLASLVKKIPSDKLMIETDAPFILPRDLPFKAEGRRNEPKYLPHIAEVIARHVGKNPEEFAKETFDNTKRFFGI